MYYHYDYISTCGWRLEFPLKTKLRLSKLATAYGQGDMKERFVFQTVVPKSLPVIITKRKRAKSKF